MLCSRSASLIDDDARVLRDREQQLAVVLDLPLLRSSCSRQLADLRQAVDDRGDLLAELALDVGDRDRGVLDDVVDQPARDGDGVELQVGEDLRDLDAVRDVRLAGEALLPAVRLLAEPIGAREQVPVEPLAGQPITRVGARSPGMVGRAAERRSPSQQSCLREARVPPPSDDHVVVHRNVEQPARRDQLLRHRPVVRATASDRRSDGCAPG